jgi:hypothetical protein
MIEYGTEVAPEPRSVPPDAGTRVPKVSLQEPGLVELMRNQPEVASPPGTPAPLRTAEDVVIDVAAEVEAVGAAANTCDVAQSASTKRPT